MVYKMQKITIADVLGLMFTAGHGAQIDILSPDGEIITTVAPDPGVRSFGEWVGRYPLDSILEWGAVYPVPPNPDRTRSQKSKHHTESSANVDFAPSSADTAVRRMEQILKRQLESEKRTKRALARPIEKVEPVVESFVDPVVEPVVEPFVEPVVELNNETKV